MRGSSRLQPSAENKNARCDKLQADTPSEGQETPGGHTAQHSTAQHGTALTGLFDGAGLDELRRAQQLQALPHLAARRQQQLGWQECLHPSGRSKRESRHVNYLERQSRLSTGKQGGQPHHSRHSTAHTCCSAGSGQCVPSTSSNSRHTRPVKCALRARPSVAVLLPLAGAMEGFAASTAATASSAGGC